MISDQKLQKLIGWTPHPGQKNIIDSKADTWAWVIWPKTTEILEKELTKKILIEKVEESSLDQKMLLKIWVYKA